MPIPSARWFALPVPDVVRAGATRTPTPMNPPISPAQMMGLGRGAVPSTQPSSAIYIGTVATNNEARLLGTHCSEMVTLPFPQSRRQPPTMNALFQVIAVGAGAPAARAMTYMIRPEIINREPAIRNGGIDSIEQDSEIGGTPD